MRMSHYWLNNKESFVLNNNVTYLQKLKMHEVLSTQHSQYIKKRKYILFSNNKIKE